MRDLKRRHAKLPAYKMFENLKVQCFTPMVHRLVVVGGKRVDQEVPFMQDLLFVKDTREHLDAIVESTPKLQYRYKLGVQHTPIIVPVADMERFIKAVEASDNPKFYSPDEVTPEMRNRKIRHHRRAVGRIYGHIGDHTWFEDKKAAGGTAHLVGCLHRSRSGVYSAYSMRI